MNGHCSECGWTACDCPPKPERSTALIWRPTEHGGLTIKAVGQTQYREAFAHEGGDGKYTARVHQFAYGRPDKRSNKRRCADICIAAEISKVRYETLQEAKQWCEEAWCHMPELS